LLVSSEYNFDETSYLPAKLYKNGVFNSITCDLALTHSLTFDVIKVDVHAVGSLDEGEGRVLVEDASQVGVFHHQRHVAKFGMCKYTSNGESLSLSPGLNQQVA
jgi:hypothetical protein